MVFAAKRPLLGIFSHYSLHNTLIDTFKAAHQSTCTSRHIVDSPHTYITLITYAPGVPCFIVSAWHALAGIPLRHYSKPQPLDSLRAAPTQGILHAACPVVRHGAHFWQALGGRHMPYLRSPLQMPGCTSAP